MAYDKNKNYQEEINKAVASGDYASASRLEKERNEKIDGEGLSYTKTSDYVKPEGITDATYNAMNKKYTNSEKQLQLDKNKNAAGTQVTNLTNKKNIISNSTWKDIDRDFKVPTAVKKADAWLSNQLELIQSGKTSYSDQVKDMMDKIINREKFSYDVDNDQLFQQALASAMGSGKIAMQDTIGQASALTGGYGSTYATTAGNQAYNAFIEDAYDNLPQYYQMAMEAYQMEGEEMYRQYGMLSAEDDKEFNRNVTAYDATYQHRNQLYNEAYTQYRDSKSDAFSMANLELSEHGQRISDALNAYNVASDLAETEYQRNYNSWLDSINIAMQQASMERGAYEYDKTFDENVRQYEQTFNKSGSGGSGGGGGGIYKLSTAEINGLTKAYNEGGEEAAVAYLMGIGKEPTDDNELAIIQNILSGEDTKIAKKKEANTPKVTGTISEFRTKEGDNFTVKVSGKNYGVENHGKVTDSKTLKSLNNLNTGNKSVFLYNGTAYAKYADTYYEIGAKMFGGKDYEGLIKALQK